MYNKVINRIKPLGFTWETRDPFLICVHHADAYPEANSEFGPDRDLAGRNLGQDFSGRDGWSMYHGRTAPGFPVHPHRGFETVTIVLEGIVDHSDSFGASGRYGHGDVQWMTAGSGLQHAEMFPLLKRDAQNPLHLFQVWLNLPARDKFSAPHYKMLWDENIPQISTTDKNGKKTDLRLIAGELGEHKAPPPAPDSWAAAAENEVAIWIIRMEAGARWVLPAATQPLNRTLYFYEGSDIHAAGSEIPANHALELLSDEDLNLECCTKACSFLLLQGRPIGEPVVQYGPFVMNTQQEIQQAFSDYRRTQFGGWPWENADPVHGTATGRFARYSNGSEEKPGT